jgi:hypothetical protein
MMVLLMIEVITPLKAVSRITPNIILGPHPSVACPPMGETEYPEFDMIVSCTSTSDGGLGFPVPFNNKPRGLLQINDVDSMSGSGLTYENLVHAAKDLNTMVDKGRVVYVHCMGGVSRSPTLVVASLMLKHKWSYRKALDFVSSKRDVVNPNPYFRVLLRQIEETLTLERI